MEATRLQAEEEKAEAERLEAEEDKRLAGKTAPKKRTKKSLTTDRRRDYERRTFVRV